MQDMTDTTPPDDTLRRRPRIAVNPIPYWSRGGKVDKSREVFDEAFADFRDIGFTAVKADVPKGMRVAEYADWIRSYGLAPSLSLFNSPFDETIDIVDEVERAKRFAADQVALGLDRTMVSSMAVPARMAQPAVGADFDKDRLALAIDNCGIVCQVLQLEGLRPCTTHMSAASSRPRTRSAACSTRLARTSSERARTPVIFAGQAWTRQPSSGDTPTGSAASTSRIALLTISIPQLEPE
jgi:hypothetical protein